MRASKYISTITVLLFTIAFLVTLPGFIKNIRSPQILPDSVAPSAPADENSGGNSSGAGSTENENSTGSSSGSEDGGQSKQYGKPVQRPSGVLTEMINADNPWALFLVDREHGLPEGYPDKISTEIVDGSFKMDARCSSYMKNMLADALADGVDIWVVSSLRTEEYQQNLLDKEIQDWKNKGYSDEEARKTAATWVTAPGHSEHNSGLAADLNERGNYYLSEQFEETKQFAWLQEHAAEYGFILRYPKNKESITGISYEPWHWRFVGVYHAKQIASQALCLEEYLALPSVSGLAAEPTLP